VSIHAGECSLSAFRMQPGAGVSLRVSPRSTFPLHPSPAACHASLRPRGSDRSRCPHRAA
jgi:hypothetical protein